ncbi:MAG: inorganic diphosphatase, partial [Candidatus Krumholzibacteria bacterium]|nr:inorganic diphosphatase [Candidatus Krumholzibacteria bacterium]
DGDTLDILVMVNEPTFTGCLIQARAVGLFRMRDRGVSDFKILGVPNADPLFAEYRDLKDVPSHFLREVEHFFATYKQLEGAAIETDGWASAEEALAEVCASVARFRK